MQLGTADAVVIGAGIIGSAIALELARIGIRSVVLDQRETAGAGTTSFSTANIRFHYSTKEGVVASWEAKHLWENWEDYLGCRDESGLAKYYRPGMLRIEPPGDGRQTILESFKAVGVPYEEWEADDIAERAPLLDTGRYWPPKSVEDPGFWADAEEEVSGYFMPDGGFIDDPQLAAHNLMVAALACGATFRFRARVDHIETKGGRVAGVVLEGGETLDTGVVINAGGPYSGRLNVMAGVAEEFGPLNIRPLRTEVHVVPCPAEFTLATGGISVDDSDLGTYFRPQPSDTLLIGGLEPECDPLIWVDDPDDFNDKPTVETWEAQLYRVSRRVRGLPVPSRPTGFAALYDASGDWRPVYDRTSLDGYYVAIGTSGNQFKNGPLVGRVMAFLVDACENGRKHDSEPIEFRCEETGQVLNVGHFSRLRSLGEASNVIG